MSQHTATAGPQHDPAEKPSEATATDVTEELGTAMGAGASGAGASGAGATGAGVTGAGATGTGASGAGATGTGAIGRPRVAYIVSRFPKLTETFVLFEMLALEEMGLEIELYPLLRARNTGLHAEGAPLWRKLAQLVLPARAGGVMHPEAARFVARARYQPFLSGAILRSQLFYLRRRPRVYLGTLGALLKATWGSRRFFLGGLALFPKTVHNARLMAEDGITHVHAHFASHPAAAAFVVHRLTGIPYSFTAHGSDLHVDRHMLCEKVTQAAFVATVSEFNKRVIMASCADGAPGSEVADRVIIVRCGVDPTVFQPPAQAEAPATRPFTIVCVGTLYEVKGQAYLVEACRLLADRGLDFACYLIGDGPHRERLAGQIEAAGLAGRVHLTGPRTRAEVAELLRTADVVAAPSVPTEDGRREGIPVALMEAMACGLPAVASDLSGIPELVIHERTGLLAPPRDSAALAAALARLQGDPALRRRLGQAALDHVRSEFDLATNAARLAARFRPGGHP